MKYLHQLRVKGDNRKLSYGRRTVIVQLLSLVWLFETPWTAAHQAPLSFTISWSLLKLTSIESVMTSNHLILCYPLLLLPSIFPSIRVFPVFFQENRGRQILKTEEHAEQEHGCFSFICKLVGKQTLSSSQLPDLLNSPDTENSTGKVLSLSYI